MSITNCAIAEQLRQLGVDAVAIQRERPDLEGQGDDAVLRTASTERRVVVTNNVRDFAPLVEDFGRSRHSSKAPRTTT